MPTMPRDVAEDFLLQLDGVIAWECTPDYPLPPLDRVELARRLLEQVNPIDDSPGAPFDRTRLIRQPDHIQVEWLCCITFLDRPRGVWSKRSRRKSSDSPNLDGGSM